MQSTVIPLTFVGALGVFTLWLLVMLRHERSRRVALSAASRERARLHRQYTLNARPAVPATPITAVTSVSVVRAGAFCRVPGNVGRTKKGVVLVCEPTANGRPRWRRPVPLRAAS